MGDYPKTPGVQVAITSSDKRWEIIQNQRLYQANSFETQCD
jgi:hypothetical protein